MTRRTHGPERIASMVLGGFLLCAALVGCGYFYKQKALAQKVAEDQLKTISELKVLEITHWRQEQQDDAETILRSSLVDSVVKEYLEFPDSDAVRPVQELVARWRAHGHYSRGILLDSQLRLRISDPPGPSPTNALTRSFASLALHTNQALSLDFHQETMSNSVAMNLFIPLRIKGSAAEGWRASGVLILEADPNEFLSPLIKFWPTPSRSGETLLVRREGDEVVYLNELRRQSNTTLHLRLSLTNTQLPAVQAVLGQTGLVKGVDYGGVPVLAAVRKIPNSPWFVVAKMDLAEVYAPSRQQAGMLGIAMGALVLAASLGVGLVWRQREAQFAHRELEERTKSKEALQQSYSLLRATFDSVADGIMVVSFGRITDFNRRFAELWRIPEALLASRDDALVLARVLEQLQDPEGFMAKVKELYAQPEAISFDVVEFKDGRVFERYSQPQWINGKPVGRVWSFRDVTEHKRAEELEVRLRADLEEKNQELERLVYAASHDLRAPLVNIEGFSKRLEKSCRELTRMTSELPDTYALRTQTITQTDIPKSLNYIHCGVVKMNALISGLLRVSRLGQVALHICPLDMTALLHQITETLAFQIQKAQAEVVIEPLPSCEGDSQLINQVFTNLLDNALKYRDPARSLKVQVSGREEAGRVVYQIKDNGLGIPPESQAKIWELFHRLSPGGPVEGEGLGLNLVWRIVHRHQGRAWVESIAGQGSSFFVALPRPSRSFVPTLNNQETL